MCYYDDGREYYVLKKLVEKLFESKQVAFAVKLQAVPSLKLQKKNNNIYLGFVAAVSYLCCAMKHRLEYAHVSCLFMYEACREGRAKLNK